MQPRIYRISSGRQRKKCDMAEKMKSARIVNQTQDLLLESRQHPPHHVLFCGHSERYKSF
jgi:hypothetical protein